MGVTNKLSGVFCGFFIPDDAEEVNGLQTPAVRITFTEAAAGDDPRIQRGKIAITREGTVNAQEIEGSFETDEVLTLGSVTTFEFYPAADSERLLMQGEIFIRQMPNSPDQFQLYGDIGIQDLQEPEQDEKIYGGEIFAFRQLAP